MKKTNFKLALALTAAVAVTGCGETKLISAKKAPDELEVVDAPPLSLPPSFELRPPKKGEVVLSAKGNVEAKDIILGKKKTLDVNKPVQKLQIKPRKAEDIIVPESYKKVRTEAKEVEVDSWLVEKSGGTVRDENIRKEVQEDFEIEEKENGQGWFSKQFGRKAREARAKERAAKIEQEYELKKSSQE